MEKAITVILLLAAVCLILGCSGSDTTPILPSTPNNETLKSVSENSSEFLWGIWDLSFNEQALTMAIEPDRAGMAHFNVTTELIPPKCSDCLVVNVNSFSPVTGIADVDVTLRNPQPFSGYDVRGILYTDASGHLLTNPDDWTPSYDIPGGDTFNPFRAYAKAEANRKFASLAQHTENFLVQFPTPPAFNKLKYAVTASWPGNAKDPYMIDGFQQMGEITEQAGSSATVQVMVYDWQSDVDYVRFYAPTITGNVSDDFTNTTGNTWELTLANNLGVSTGDYQVMIEAHSTGSPSLSLYDFATVTISPAPLPQGWAITWGGGGGDYAKGVANDVSGNIYMVGDFGDTVDFNPGSGIAQASSNGASDYYLSKFDQDGNFLWVKTWGGTGADFGNGIAIDGSGNILVCGAFSTTVDFDPGAGTNTHISNGSVDASISKFDPDGNFIWARSWGGDDYDWGAAVDTDDAGEVYIAGHFGGFNVDFDPGIDVATRTCQGIYDPFVTKFNILGIFLWAQTWGGWQDDRAMGVAVDGYGYVYVAARFLGSVDFDPGPTEDIWASNGFTDVSLSKFAATGEYFWARVWGGPDGDEPTGVALSSDGSMVCVTGYFNGTVDFDPLGFVDNKTSAGGMDAFLIELDSLGYYQWADTWGGSAMDYASCVTMADTGEIFVGGGFAGTADVDPGMGSDMRTSNGFSDVLASKFDSDGVLLWARNWGGTAYDAISSVLTEGNGKSYWSGNFGDIVDFNPGVGIDYHSSNGSNDAFLSILPPDGNW